MSFMKIPFGSGLCHVHSEGSLRKSSEAGPSQTPKLKEVTVRMRMAGMKGITAQGGSLILLPATAALNGAVEARSIPGPEKGLV
jgi:hypothetical protein